MEGSRLAQPVGSSIYLSSLEYSITKSVPVLASSSTIYLVCLFVRCSLAEFVINDVLSAFISIAMQSATSAARSAERYI